MKKLLGIGVALLLAVPVMAIHLKEEKIELPETSLHEREVLTCKVTMQEEEGYKKICKSSDGLTRLFITWDEDYAAYDMEEELGEEPDRTVSKTIQCKKQMEPEEAKEMEERGKPQEETEYVYLLKAKVPATLEEDDPREGVEDHVMELMGRALYNTVDETKPERKGYIALMGFYNPDPGSAITRDDFDLIKLRNAKAKEFVLFDKGDMDWLCGQELLQKE